MPDRHFTGKNLVGDIEDGAIAAGTPLLLDRPAFDPASVKVGEASAAAGRWQMDCLALALGLTREGRLDGYCFAPLNKDAMLRAGLKHEDEQGFFAYELGHTGPLGIMNTVGNLWTSRVTSHVAHRDVSGLITAGAEGIAVAGPFPADTIFLKGCNGEYDAIVTMFHDQGQIAMKLMDFDHGVTVHAGLPFPITTSAHGTAFDIAGKGVANADALHQAFILAGGMAAQ